MEKRILADSPSSLETFQGVCASWIQVNNSGFGLNSQGEYLSEEGFEVLTFKERLYLGMEADNSLGARLWRTKEGVVVPHSQADFEEVAASPKCDTYANPQDSTCDPFGDPVRLQNDHVDSLAEFKDKLYASTANGGDSTLGTRVYRSASGDPGTWQDAIKDNGPGFGDINNTNFKDMQVFDGWLCGGTRNWMTGAQVWCTQDGSTWKLKNTGGFGLGNNNPKNIEIWSGLVFEDHLYFGVQNIGMDGQPNTTDDVAVLFRTGFLANQPSWEEVYVGIPGSKRVDILGAFNGQLYISYLSGQGVIVASSPSGDTDSWNVVNRPGMDGDANNTGAVVDSAVVYNGALYIGIYNEVSGVEVWRTTGKLSGDGPQVDWEKMDGSGLGDPKNVYTELVVFNGYLYAWTSNYVSGQQVLRSKCPICERKAILSPDQDYDFSSVGARLQFSIENLDQVDVCVYPGAPPEDVREGLESVLRHYTITGLPADGTDGSFLADLTLSYLQQEYEDSSVSGEESSMTLARQIGVGVWDPCPDQHLVLDPEANLVYCKKVSEFSTWGVINRDSIPQVTWLPVIKK